MNREYLLDSLDGLKGLLFRLLPKKAAELIGSVPMTTDGPWTDGERENYETAVGIPADRTYWSPGGFHNVPPSNDLAGRDSWLNSIAEINHPYLFLDPDTGFYTRYNRYSEKKILVSELIKILQYHDGLIVYRHRYWPKRKSIDIPTNVYPYVWHCLSILRNENLSAFVYQSQAASFFFIAKQVTDLKPLFYGFRSGMCQ